MYVLHPGIVRLIGLLPQIVQGILGIVIVVLFAVDLSTTVRGMVAFQHRMERLSVLSAQIKEKLDTIHWRTDLPVRERLEQFFQEKREEHLEAANEAKESLNALLERFRSMNVQLGFIQRRLKKAFPHMVLHRNFEQVRSLREWLESKRKSDD